MKDLRFVVIPFISLILAQLIKFGLESWKAKKWRWARLFNGNGGMPSSHTAFTFSLTIALAIEFGVHSPLFAISLVFSIIVAYDAMGLRMQSGKQAQAINKIIDELFEKDKTLGMQYVKEQLGHQPMEVVMGALLGSTVAITILALI